MKQAERRIREQLSACRHKELPLRKKQREIAQEANRVERKLVKIHEQKYMLMEKLAKEIRHED